MDRNPLFADNPSIPVLWVALVAVVAEVASKVEPNRHRARRIARRCGSVMDVGMDVGLVSGLSDLFLPQKRLDKDRLLAVRWLWSLLLRM
jgi:hypothetical protein